MQTKPSPSDGPIYLSGPMTGYPEHNFPAFNEWTRRLREKGFDVVNPVEINGDDAVTKGLSWHECLRNDIRALTYCGSLALMPGWQYSQGAQLENMVAHRLGLKICHVEDLL